VVINVPPGVVNGDTIRYTGLGDDSIGQVQRGNLNVTIMVMPDPSGRFERRGDDLYTSVEITPIDAMIGCRKTIPTITGSSIDLEIRAGVESGVEFASHGTGFTNVNSGNKGRFVTVVKVKAVSVTDPTIVDQLKVLQESINRQ
jgi:DnaJ-class molecular chaperone